MARNCVLLFCECSSENKKMKNRNFFIIFFLFYAIILCKSDAKFEKDLLQQIDAKDVDVNIYLNYGNRKMLKPMTTAALNSFLTGSGKSAGGGGSSGISGSGANKSKVDILSKIFKNSVQNLRQKTKRVDLVFLIDSSSSVGKVNFLSEIRFVKKMLGDFNVSFNYTRVAIVTFSSLGKIVSKT